MTRSTVLRMRAWALILLSITNRTFSATISNPFKEDGDINKVLPDYYDHKRTKAYHNATPTRATPVGAVDFGKAGDSSCAVKFRLRWAAEIESAVLSAPVIFPSGPEGKNEIYINTFYQYVEILGFDGYKPFGWPISFEEASFHGSPMLYDIDGDGKNDIGMVDSDANMYWVRVGEFGQYLAEFHVQVPKLKVRRNWFEGLSEEYVDNYVALSMFDRDAEDGKSDTPKAKLDVLSVKSPRQASYPGLSSRGRRLLEDRGGSSNTNRGDDDAPGVGRLEGGLAEEGSREEDDAVPQAELEEGLLNGAFHGEEPGGEAPEDDYMRRFRDHPNPFGDGGGSYYHDFDQGSAPDWEGEETMGFYSAQRHRHYMDDMFAHSYYAAGMDMYNDTKFAFIDPHVLSSPVLVDLDGDGNVEVIMTISYYFDSEKYRGVDLGFDPQNFVAGGIASWNLELQTWNWLVHLDLTTDKSRFKALIHSTPTVADIDGDGRSEIIFGTSLGLLYVLDGESGFVRRFFPMQFHEIQSQVAVADVVGGLDLEIIFGDMGGNVICLNGDGDVLWDAKVSGVVTQTPTIGDIDGDGDLDVVVTATYYSHDSMYHSPNSHDAENANHKADKGCHIWAFDGATGEVLPMFPMALPAGSVAISPVVLVDLHDYSDNNEKSGDQLLEKDIADLLKVAEGDTEVMSEVKKRQTIEERLAAGKPKKSNKARKRKLHSLSDPAVPPWVQTTAGHEAPPSPSLQTTSSILGSQSGGSTGNIRGKQSGKKSDLDEETVLESISKVLARDSQFGHDERSRTNETTGKFFSDMAENRRRIKEAELLKHIRYRADSGALGLHLIVAAGDGHIYIIDGAKGCAERVDIGEHVYSMPLVDDLSQDGFLDLVVGTVNGQVLALETEILNVWSAFPKHRGNGFTHGVSGISVPAHEKKLLRYADTLHRHQGGAAAADEGAEVESDDSGSWLPVTFDIWDARGALYDPLVERYYDVTFTAGMNRKENLLKKRFSSPGRYTVLIPVQPPDSYLLMIGMTNEHGQYYEDSVTISLCTQFYVWIKYIVCAPVILFSLALLFMKASL